MTHDGTACLWLVIFDNLRFFAVGLWRAMFYRLVIFISRRCVWSLASISFSCGSVIGVGTFPVCAIWMSWSSSALAKSGLTILRLFMRCLASGVSIRLSMACFCASSCCCACARFCSCPRLCCSSSIRRRRISSSSASSISSSLNLNMHRRYGYFFSCGFCFSNSSWICAASRSSVFLPSLVMVLPFGVFSMSPAVSSCCMIFLMFVPAPFRACSLLTFLPVLPP